MAVRESGPATLTTKGQATRARIVAAAADLIYTNGVRGTNNELLRKATGVSGSQLNHYFPDKESLVRAVIAWQADRVVELHQSPQFAGFDTFATFRAWADYYVRYEDAYQRGCGLGSLASEIIKSDLDVHDQFAAEFDRWEEVFRRGLRRMRDRGDLRIEANPDHLTRLLMAAFQGGMLLAQVARDSAPLRDALEGAIAYVETFASAARSSTII